MICISALTTTAILSAPDPAVTVCVTVAGPEVFKAPLPPDVVLLPARMSPTNLQGAAKLTEFVFTAIE